MLDWHKITPNTAKRYGRRCVFAVNRHGDKAALIVPAGMIDADANRAEIFHDGGNRLAFRFGDTGEFAVWHWGNGARSLKVHIPAGFADAIPAGTTDVAVHKDGGFYVLDLGQLRGRTLAVVAA